MQDMIKLITHVTLAVTLLCIFGGSDQTDAAATADIFRLRQQLESYQQMTNSLQQRLESLEKRSAPTDLTRFEPLSRQKRQSRRSRGERIVLSPWLFPVSEVGFHIALTTTRSFNTGETIIFDHVITNLGNSLSRETGTFTCPRAGTYLFNLNILGDKGSYMEAAIMHNDMPVFKALSYNRTPGTYNQGSGSAIVILAKGDKVKVVMVKPLEARETLLGGYSHFSGYLLS